MLFVCLSIDLGGAEEAAAEVVAVYGAYVVLPDCLFVTITPPLLGSAPTTTALRG